MEGGAAWQELMGIYLIILLDPLKCLGTLSATVQYSCDPGLELTYSTFWAEESNLERWFPTFSCQMDLHSPVR